MSNEASSRGGSSRAPRPALLEPYVWEPAIYAEFVRLAKARLARIDEGAQAVAHTASLFAAYQQESRGAMHELMGEAGLLEQDRLIEHAASLHRCIKQMTHLGPREAAAIKPVCTLMAQIAGCAGPQLCTSYPIDPAQRLSDGRGLAEALQQLRTLIDTLSGLIALPRT